MPAGLDRFYCSSVTGKRGLLNSAVFHVNQVLHHVVAVAIRLDTDDLPITGLNLQVAILVQPQDRENLVSLCV